MSVRTSGPSTTLEPPAESVSILRPSPRALFQYFLMLGATGFGGPTAGPIWQNYMSAAQGENCPEFEVPTTLPTLSPFSSEHTRSASEVSSGDEGEEEEKGDKKKQRKEKEAEEGEAEEEGEEEAEKEAPEPEHPEPQVPPQGIGGGVAPH